LVACDICESKNVSVRKWLVVGPCDYKFSEEAKWISVPAGDNIVMFDPVKPGPVLDAQQDAPRLHIHIVNTQKEPTQEELTARFSALQKHIDDARKAAATKTKK
jgi:hypothetical protein